AGTMTVTVREIHKHESNNYPWQTKNVNFDLIKKAPPMLKIVPTKFHNSARSFVIGGKSDYKTIAIGQSVNSMIENAYGIGDSRIVFLTAVPSEQYDYVLTLPSGARKSFQQEIERKFGIVCKREMIDTNALLLVVDHLGAPGLKPGGSKNGSGPFGAGEISFNNDDCNYLAANLESRLGIPVIDQTGLTN